MQAEPLFIINATLLSYNQSVVYFGSDIGFKKNIEITVECVSDDITGGPSSTSVFSLVDAVKDYGELFINGQGFGAAKLTGFSAGAANMEDSISVSVSFLICAAFDDLSKDGALSGYYADYKKAQIDGCLLESFSDTLSLSRGENSTSYTRNISITANNSKNLTDIGGVIRNYARVILGFTTFSFPDLSAFESEINDLTGSNIKKNITETVDEIGLTFSFQESMSAGNVKGSYSLVSSNNYTKNAAGIARVSENGTILGLTDPRFAAAEAGYTTELAAAKVRIVDVFNGYNDDGCDPLNTKDDGSLLLLTSGKTENEFEGTIVYTIAANNDPKYKDTDGNLWEYTTSVSSDGLYQTSTEQGTLAGKGNEIYNKEGGEGLLLYTKYQHAKDFFLSDVETTINGRVSSLISSPSPKPTSRTEAHAPVKGTMGYTRVFSNNPKFAENNGIAKSITTSTVTNKGVPTQSKYVCLSPDDAKEIIQTPGPLSLATVTNSIQTMGYRIKFADEKSKSRAFGTLGIGKVSFGSMDYLSSIKYTFKGANDVVFTLSTTHSGGDDSCP